MKPITSLQQFLEVTSLSRAKFPSKSTLDKAINECCITSPDLIADIYGYFLY